MLTTVPAQTLPTKVAKVDAKEVARVTKKYLVVDDMPAVIVGPKVMSEEKFKAVPGVSLEVR